MAFAIDDENDQAASSQVDANSPQGGTGVGVSAPGGQQNQNGGVSLGAAGSAVSGGGQPNGGNVGGPLSYSQAPPQTQTQNQSQWTNVQDYLKANSDQSESLGNQIGGNVAKTAQSAEDQAASAANDFTNQVNQSVVSQNPDSINQDIANATNLKAGQSYSDSDLNDFQKQANANYSGPTDFTTHSQYGSVANALNNASQSVSQLGSEAGRDVLLQNQFGNSSPTGYNAGESNLDQLLLSGNPANEKTLSGVQKQYSGINQVLGNTTQQENALAQQGIGTNQATSQAAKTALTNANTQFQTRLQNEVAAATAGNKTAYDAILAALAEGSLSPDQFQATGLTAGEHLYGMTPDQLKGYVTAGSAPTIDTLSSPDEYAQAQALATLGGPGAASLLPNASLASTAGPAYTFNAPQFNSDLSARTASYQQALTSANQTVSQSAPMSGDWLKSMDSRSTSQNIADLQSQLNFWQTTQNGNPTQATNLQNLQTAISQLQNVMNLYSPDTGLRNANIRQVRKDLSPLI